MYVFSRSLSLIFILKNDADVAYNVNHVDDDDGNGNNTHIHTSQLNGNGDGDDKISFDCEF